LISSNLLFLIIFFSLVLIVLVFVYVKSMKKKALQHQYAAQGEVAVKTSVPTFLELKAIIKNRSSSSAALEQAVNDLMKYYGEIPPKRGISTDKMFDEYATLLIALCRHPNTNAKIVVLFDKLLRQKNPSYENNIEAMLTKGLESRG
jgi:hypothetical protein